MNLLLLGSAAALLCLTRAAPVDDEAFVMYQVIEAIPTSREQVHVLAALEENGFQVDFWRESATIGQPAEIMVSPEEYEDLVDFLFEKDIKTTVLVEDVSKLINEQFEQLQERVQPPFQFGMDPRSLAIDQYHSHQEINDWLQELASAHSDIASVVSLGTSHEGRDMRVIKIGKAGANKPGFWIDAGIHAREWASPATSLYIINELVTKYASNGDYKRLVDGLDIYVLPSLNPDGYEFSRSSRRNRLWRKNRSGPYCKASSKRRCTCKGVDLNRNWDFHWREPGASGSSSHCSIVFAGPSAFSESESQNVRDFLMARKGTMHAYISLHTYSEFFMYNYSYKRATYPDNHDALDEQSTRVLAAIKAVHNTRYRKGSSPDILYAAAGVSADWAQGVAGIPWSYTMELRPGHGDTDHDFHYGFMLPASYIVRTADEAWAGLQVVMTDVLAERPTATPPPPTTTTACACKC